MTHAFVDGTTEVPCHWAGATSASGGRGRPRRCVCPPQDCVQVDGQGGPGVTQGRRTENHDVPRLISRLALRVGNPSHSYHPEGFYTGATSPVVR